jgi:hypothetical protein
MITRDSSVLYLAAAAAALTYLINADPPTTWGYNEWLQAASFAVAYALGKLQTSPLEGAAK